MDHPQLNQLEQRTYRSVVDDGLIDIFLGCFFVILGFTRNTDLDLLVGLSMVVFVGLWKLLRQHLIEPRAGMVRLHPTRQRRLRQGANTMATSFIFLCVVAAILLFTVFDASWRTEFGDLRPVVGAIMFGAPVAISGFVFEMTRLYIYSGILVVLGVLELTVPLPMSTGMFVSGGLLLAIGSFFLVRFLQRYPRPTQATSSDV